MNITECTPSSWVAEEKKWLKQLEEHSTRCSFPYSNNTDFSIFPNGSLIRFRGMVQDMHGPEFYVEEFQKTNSITGEISRVSGKYIDSHHYEEHEEVEPAPDNKTGERHMYTVITIPALNSWVNHIDNTNFGQTLENYRIKESSATSKRSLDEEMMLNCSISPNKRQCTETNTPQANSSTAPEQSRETTPSNIFPLKNPANKHCFVLIYNNSDGITLNSLYDFYGFLSRPNPDEENPVPVPRIHCVFYEPIKHCNPLIDSTLSEISNRFQCIKKELQIVLTNLLFGDELAAEYLIFNLISNVYLRKDLLALGKFTLNISNIPQLENMDYPKELYKFIELLTTKSYYLEMTLKNMNELNFMAKKNYNDNHLMSSLLQLSPNTQLVLDETKLTAGQLNENGVKALKTIGNAIMNQKVNYDFIYYQLEYDSDIRFLILSEGKSLLPSDLHIILQPDEMHLKTFKEITEAARHFLKPELLNHIRVYLTAVRLQEYNFEENMEELIQKEYVEMRQNSGATSDDLHNLLVLARFVCLSEGKKHLDEASWKKACALEAARKNRLQSLKK